MDDGLEALWKHVEAGWDDAARHERFLEHARRTDALPTAAARYRAVAEAEDGRRDEARRRLTGIALLAVSALEAAKTPPRTKPPTWMTASVVVATIVVVVWVLRIMGGR